MDPIVLTILFALGVNLYAYETGDAPSMFGEKTAVEKVVEVEDGKINWEK